ncbi:MAG TPA: OmpA family protein [Luteibaculaceae bacterium]|nr:OmpA family protein [Luteibaculaceae bacterium]
MKLQTQHIATALFAVGMAVSSIAQDGPKMIRKFDAVKALPSTINSDNEESLPLLTAKKDTMYFVRTYVKADKKHKKGEQDIWFSVNEKGSWTEASNNLPKVNNKFNNGALGLSADGSKMYVLNQYPNESYLTAKGYSVAGKSGAEWSKPKTLMMPKIDFMSDLYGAYFTPDESVAILSLNATGSIGDEDLWVSIKNENGTWGTPINLGGTINTGKADFAPFLSADKKTLYFASYGHKGLGDADIFYSTRQDNGWTNWSTPENMGEPVNSKAFDAYMHINAENEIYFSSKRGGKSYSDIYFTRMYFEKVPEPVKEVPKVDSTALELEALKKKYTDLSLIHFKFDKSDIQTGDVPILEDVIDLMKRRDKIRVTLIGHADAKGSEEYNLKLSERRVKAAKEYLIAKGIDASRIETKALGKTKPVATNDTAKGRAENRRVEISVTIQ